MLPLLARLAFTLVINQNALCGILARLACALSRFPGLLGLPVARLMSKHKKADVLPPAALALLCTTFPNFL